MRKPAPALGSPLVFMGYIRITKIYVVTWPFIKTERRSDVANIGNRRCRIPYIFGNNHPLNKQIDRTAITNIDKGFGIMVQIGLTNII